MASVSSDHAHGSPHVWDDVYKNLDLSYSEKGDTQGKLFELVKISFLKELFRASGMNEAKKKMLEVGCGTAFVSLYFAKRGYHATCLDINKSILEVASRNFAQQGVKGEFIVGDAEKFPFAKNQFDIVMSFGLLEHFEDPKRAISEMIRVLKPGGLFFADIVPSRFSCQTVGNVFNSLAALSFWTVKGQPALGVRKAIRNFKPDYLENSISWQGYKKMMEGEGLKNIEVRGNRPFPRLTLPKSFDKMYAAMLKTTLPFWNAFDRWDSPIPKLWGAGLWFLGYK